MQLKNLLKGIGLTLLCSSVYAKDDCKELKSIAKKNKVSVNECVNNDKGEVVKISFFGEENNTFVDKLVSYKTIKDLYYDEEYARCESLVNKLKNLYSLETLSISSFRGSIEKNVLKNLTQLKRLNLYNTSFPQYLIEDIETLSNLEELTLGYVRYRYENENYEHLAKSLKKLRYLRLTNNGKTGVPKELLKAFKTINELYIDDLKLYRSDLDIIGTYTDITSLKIHSSDIQDRYALDPIRKLKTLEILDLYTNDKIDDPKALAKELPKLKVFIYNGESIEFESNSDPNQKISTNGRCGPQDGKCPTGQCCSKYGWCGNTEKHCGDGCQGEFSQCNNSSMTSTTVTITTTTTTISSQETISSNGKCGPQDGKCPAGQCCSKYGWCGKSEKYCGAGCQSDFGFCNYTLKISTNGKCGPKDGKCPAGKCCSKHGWCGNTSEHCKNGCQSEFGDCQ
ncbi:L domain-like protein [Anaeromyces robustus]|jgi:hypothetical protein|uniref:L domain-like protein n=1 Tax=Anaeromyces robustus TaxID=1754192 RepID=A0A1Y1X9L0_9FUNG|nr:L domain-like protein [Anaeromyces robustus]|eukprot:ORX82461.1 L domain-like protein [Anaeromyces robustus]